ncbi:hypothetical protein JTE90_000571 [Oedothorax gibbosus]|uniref:IRF tryptophan pentad repeat domain-containing protein n=1 Tax=Oedothorax gibbosus TaxID=931172 RepID=A0AAV6VXK3_9ARAC|nr:hypothetical protein JTE90_000571 [Oedothorax gibbosus]
MPPKPNYRLIPDFIVPNLEKETYGRHLVWDDKKKGSFKISRIHQSSEQWNDDCIAVYKAWSAMKNLWEPDDPKKCTKAKHRLITALRRNPVVEMLETEAAYYRFRIAAAKIEGEERTDKTLQQEKESYPYMEENVSPKNRGSNKNNNPPICSSRSSDPFQSNIKLLMALPERVSTVENKHDCVHTSCDFETEFNKEHFFTLDENSPELSNTPEKIYDCSDTCCCAVLLDSTLLSNERCIWHGVPS